MLARRQHGDDDFGVGYGGGGARSLVSACSRECLEGCRHHIEPDHFMAGLDEIDGHWPPHIAEADECDPAHVMLLDRVGTSRESELALAQVLEIPRHFRFV